MYITEILDSEDIRSVFNQSNVGVVVSDPKTNDNPMVYANKTFLEMTGYDRDEVIGRNCRFLQGEGTDDAAVSAIRAALKERTSISLVIKNYKKNGTGFWNRLNISPIFDKNKNLKFFLGIQEDITTEYTLKIAQEERIKELENKLKRLQREIGLKLNKE